MRLLILGLLSLAAAAPSRAQWMAAPPMGTARTGAAAAILDGRLYVVGGRDAGGALLASAEAFTPATGWAPIAPLDDARADAQLVAFEGRLYLLGGFGDSDDTDDVEIYDPGLDRWEGADRDLDRSRAGLAAGVAGGAMYVLGGAREGQVLSSAETFDGDDWNLYGPWTLAPARAGAGAASTGDALVVAGGFSQVGPVATVERFVPGVSGEALPSLPSARGGLALVAAGGALVALGGRDATDEAVAAVDRLEPGAPSWTPLAPLPEPRAGAVAAVLGPDLYVAGGTNAFGSRLATVVRLPNVVAGESGAPDASALSLSLDGPNPARGSVRLALALAAPAAVRVTVVDVRGREVATLADGDRAAGRHALSWDASRLPAGVYAIRATTAGTTAVLRVTTVR